MHIHGVPLSMMSGPVPIQQAGISKPTTSSTTSTTGTSTTSTGGVDLGDGLTGDSFLSLLVAQLQSQDPLDPMDPTQLVDQLVNFNSLEQLIQINSAISNLGSGSIGTQPSNPANTSAPANAYTNNNS